MRVQDFNVNSLSPHFTRYLRKHPTVGILAGVLIVVYSIPVSIFLAVVIVSFLLTFAGFLIIEGAIIIVAFIILISGLFTLTVFLIMASITCWLLYLMTSHVYMVVYTNITPEIFGSKMANDDGQIHSFKHEE